MPSAQITKRALAQALKTQMQQQDFSKISIGDICTCCGMSRKSFYYHFKDKYDLMNWIFYTEFLSEVVVQPNTTMWDFLHHACTYFYQERIFYRNALQVQGQNSFREYFIEVIEPFMQRFLEKILHPQETSGFSRTFLTDAFLASLVRWLSRDTTMPPSEYLSHLKRLLVDLSKQILLDFDAI